MKADERDERMDEMEETLREWMKDLEPEEIEGLVSEDSFWESPGAAMSPADRRTIRRKVYQRIRRRAPWTAFGKGVAAAACIMLLLLVWQKDTVQAGLEKLFQMIPGVGLYERRESR